MSNTEIRGNDGILYNPYKLVMEKWKPHNPIIKNAHWRVVGKKEDRKLIPIYGGDLTVDGMSLESLKDSVKETIDRRQTANPESFKKETAGIDIEDLTIYLHHGKWNLSKAKREEVYA